MEISQETVQKVLATIDAGLIRGLGEQVPGKMCVEAAICFALGLPHGDDPGCVAESLRICKMIVNDSDWSSPAARAKGLRKLSVLQLGSLGILNEVEFAKKLALFAVNKLLPYILCKTVPQLEEYAAACEQAVDLITAQAAARAAEAASRAAGWPAEAAAETAEAASWAARAAARAAAQATASAARAAARAASWAAEAVAEVADEILLLFADGVAQILIEMDVPGVQWLPLLGE